MSDLEVDVEIRNKDIAESIKDAIERGIRRGSGQTATDGLTDEMESVAKQKLRTEGKIWTGELIESFKESYEKAGGNMRITFSNVSDHAAPVEYGAEYGQDAPPLAPLAAWVMTKGANIQPPDDYDRPESADEMPTVETFEDDDNRQSSIFEQFPTTVLDQAFYLQEHIKETGIDPTGFMEDAERWAEQDGGRTVAEYISREVAKI